MLGLTHIGDSSLTLRMTLTQIFLKTKCHSEQSEESQTPTFTKEPKLFLNKKTKYNLNIK